MVSFHSYFGCALSLSCSHTHGGASGVHCFTAFFFIVAFFVSPPHSAVCHGYHTEKLNKEKYDIFPSQIYPKRAKHWALLVRLLRCFLPLFSLLLSDDLRNRMLCDEKTPEYRRTEPYQRKCATIFHDKRRTNEWNIKLKKILSYEFSVVFFFLLSFTASFLPNMREAFSNRSERWALGLGVRMTTTTMTLGCIYLVVHIIHPKRRNWARNWRHTYISFVRRWTSLQRRASARFDLNIYFSFVWPTTTLCPILWCSRILAVYFCLS